MIEKRKIIQLTLVLFGLVLAIFTYFLYPAINKNKSFEIESVNEKILQKEIKKLEKEKQALIDQIQEKKEYLSSRNIIRKKDKIEKLEKKEQALISEIQGEKEYVASGGISKKDVLKNLQTDLQETSSSLAKKRSDLKKKEQVIKDTIENLQTDLQEASSLLTEKKLALVEEEKVTKTIEGKSSNTFKNIEYGGLYDFDKPFTVKSESAYIKTEEPDIVYMTKMYVILLLADNRTVIITSDKGSYNKVTYDCIFEDNVKATDGETVILAENLDLLATEDSAVIYNNVYLTDERGSIKADKVNYDFETKYYNISMNSVNKKVKIKFIQ